MLDNYRNRFGVTRMVIISGLIYFISQAIIGSIPHDLNPLLFVKAQTTFSKDVYLASNTKWALAGISLLIALIYFLRFRLTCEKGKTKPS